MNTIWKLEEANQESNEILPHEVKIEWMTEEDEGGGNPKTDSWLWIFFPLKLS